MVRINHKDPRCFHSKVIWLKLKSKDIFLLLNLLFLFIARHLCKLIIFLSEQMAHFNPLEIIGILYFYPLNVVRFFFTFFSFKIYSFDWVSNFIRAYQCNLKRVRCANAATEQANISMRKMNTSRSYWDMKSTMQ